MAQPSAEATSRGDNIKWLLVAESPTDTSKQVSGASRRLNLASGIHDLLALQARQPWTVTYSFSSQLQGEVEKCSNAQTVANGAYFGVDMPGILNLLLRGPQEDGQLELRES